MGSSWHQFGVIVGSIWNCVESILGAFRTNGESILEACDAMPNRSEVILQLNICCYCDAMAALNPPYLGDLTSWCLGCGW